MQLKELRQWENPMTVSVIEPANMDKTAMNGKRLGLCVLLI
jgi:hypothetical protein